MVRRYEEPIEVHHAAPDVAAPPSVGHPERSPDAFVWRGRLYVVRAILDQWQERRPWWRDAREGRDVLADARERRVWRVEASPGRLGGVGVYDLGATPTGSHDSPDSHGSHQPGAQVSPVSPVSQWQLLRVAD